VHQSTRKPPQPVVLETDIVDATGRVLVTATRTIGPGEFDAAAVAEHRFDLPLAELDAGEYLLRFVATAGEAHAQRDVRFSVR